MIPIVGLIFLLLIAAPAFADGRAVVSRNVNLRPTPSTADESLGLLKPPTGLGLIDAMSTDGFLHVRTDNGLEGWVWSRNVRVEPGAAGQATVASAVSASWDKPDPVVGTFMINGRTCGPDGDGEDPDTNKRKNRTDVPVSYHDVEWSAIAALPYPKAGSQRKNWAAEQLAQIAPYEGAAVRVVGYFVKLSPQKGSAESTNCGMKKANETDWHAALVGQPSQKESESVVVETTPRVRVDHPGWTEGKVKTTIDERRAVRVSGWLMLDPSHRNHLKRFRQTLWEVHPVTEIEVERNGVWVSLDAEP